MHEINFTPHWLNTHIRNADNQCCDQTYIELYQYDPQLAYIRDITTCINNMVNSSRVSDWNWIDALIIAQHAVGLIVSINLSVADMNCDAIVNTIDSLMLAWFYVGILAALPGCLLQWGQASQVQR